MNNVLQEHVRKEDWKNARSHFNVKLTREVMPGEVCI